MGPIPRRSFIVEPLPLKTTDYIVHLASTVIRKLPPPLVRLLLLVDLALCVLPFWAWFAFRRWTGVALSMKEMRERYVRGARFAAAHFRHSFQGTGFTNLSWRSPAIRFSDARERSDYAPRGSCGSCCNCCTTHWLPGGERAVCPLLGDDGCMVFGGLYWDHFNCGRYPYKPIDTRAYDCPRFEGPIEVPDALPADFTFSPTPLERLRR